MSALIVPLVTVFLVACLTSLALTALVRKAAPHVGLTDRPDGHRKLHPKTMPLGGGVAIFLTLVGVTWALTIFPNPLHRYLQERLPNVPFLLLAGAVIVVVGLVDDRFGLRGRQKLAGQIVAASILIFGGLKIQAIGIFGMESFDLGLFAIPVTLFWILGAINALNLLDGIDGLATMVGIIIVSTIAIMALLLGRIEVAVMATIFAGGLVGFMRFNFPPASIFLGDTGSMLIGLIVGALAIQGSLKGPGTVLLAAPLAIWAIPIFDAAVAILRRRLTGRSIYTTDHAHLHHRLLGLLGSNRKVLALVAACCGLTSAAALLGVYFNSDLITLLTCMALLIILIATGVFGQAELVLLGNRLGHVGKSFLPSLTSKEDGARETTVRLQGSGEWDVLWETLVESASKFGLHEIHLNVSSPVIEEDYHSSWVRQNGNGHHPPYWQIELPLVVGDRPVGAIKVVGDRREESSCSNIQEFLDLVKPLEKEISLLREEEFSEEDVSEPAMTAKRKRDRATVAGRMDATSLLRQHSK